MFSIKLQHRCLIVLVALALLLVAGCDKSSNASPPSNKADSSSEEVQSDTDDSKAQAEVLDDVPSVDTYPQLSMSALKPAERKLFVSIAQEELCPCPDSTISLHECLQDVEQQCKLAYEAADVVGSSIREGLTQSSIQGRLATYLETANKVYEFDLTDVPHKGSPSAPVVIVEFADFLCPYCRHASNALDEVAKRYPEQVVVYFKQFPMARTESHFAARASTAAHIQGRFWPMHDLLFRHQSQLNPSRIEGFAHQIGLNFERFKKDMDSPEVANAVSRDRQEGRAAQIKGTPTIFINGRMHLGDFSAPSLSKAVELEISENARANSAN